MKEGLLTQKEAERMVEEAKVEVKAAANRAAAAPWPDPQQNFVSKMFA